MLASTPSLPSKSLELVCPAGNLPSLKAAVDQGADAVYMGSATTPTPVTFPV